MNKKDICRAVADKTGVSPYIAMMAVDTVIECMKNAMQNGELIDLRGLGTFNTRITKQKIVRDLNTGAEFVIQPRKKVVFKQSKNLL